MNDDTDQEPTAASDLSSEESEERELPKEWVETYLAEEKWVKEKLSKIKKLEYNERHSEIIEELEKMYEYNSDIFRAIFYSIHGTEDFFNDVSSQMDENTANNLRDLGEDYESILEKMAFILRNDARKNPITGGTITEPKYHPESHAIYVPYSLHSLGRDVIKTKDKPAGLLHGSFLFSEAAFEGVRAADNGELILTEDDVERIRDKLQRLKAITQDIEKRMDSIKVISEDET